MVLLGETGVVLAKEGEIVTVALNRIDACSKCGACAPGAEGRKMFISARNDCAASVGDLVNVELDGGAFISAALTMYGAPLVAFIAGTAAGIAAAERFGLSQDAAGLISGFAFLAAAYAVITLREKKRDKKKRLPVATRVTDSVSANGKIE